MTEFEQAVRAALRQVVVEARGPTFHNKSFDALAVRVADAIDCGAEMAIAPWSAALLPGDKEAVRDAALRALGAGRPTP